MWPGPFTINAGYQFNDISFPAGYLGDDRRRRAVVIGDTQFLFAPKHKFTLSGEYSTAGERHP